MKKQFLDSLLDEERSMVREYLEECGFKKDGTLKINEEFYPTISCHIRNREEIKKAGKANGQAIACPFPEFYFVLHFNPVVGSVRVSRAFTWKVPRKDLLESSFGAVLGKVFSIPDSLLQTIQNYRSKSQKHWKKRNYPIAFSKKFVYNIFDVNNKVNSNVNFVDKGNLADKGNEENGFSSLSETELENLELCKRNMAVLERKAALKNDMVYFNYWYEEYKILQKIERKRLRLKGDSRKSGRMSGSYSNRDLIWFGSSSRGTGISTKEAMSKAFQVFKKRVIEVRKEL